MSLIILNVDEVRRTLSASGGAFVVHDKEVDIVRFAINSGFADIVLDGQVALRVMYQRPGETEARAQTLTYYDTDGLRNYYDWQLLSADLTKKGTLMVALCILDISGGEVSEWHTTPCAVRVLSTIHTDDSDEGDDTITPTVRERVAVLESMIQRVASGAPIVVSSASAMTDTDQIYVLSTDGYWYYHNGTAWVAGGEYGALSTDTTLTQSGVPADAKTVGDAFAAAGSVTTEKLAAASVTTAKIADGAVTAGKLANKIITADKLADSVKEDLNNAYGGCVSSNVPVSYSAQYIRDNGTIGTSSIICVAKYLKLDASLAEIIPLIGYKIKIAEYTAEDSSTFTRFITSDNTTSSIIFMSDNTKYYAVQITAVDGSAITPSTIPANAITCNKLSWTDKNLSTADKPADALVTGNLLKNKIDGDAYKKGYLYLQKNTNEWERGLISTTTGENGSSTSTIGRQRFRTITFAENINIVRRLDGGNYVWIFKYALDGTFIETAASGVSEYTDFDYEHYKYRIAFACVSNEAIESALEKYFIASDPYEVIDSKDDIYQEIVTALNFYPNTVYNDVTIDNAGDESYDANCKTTEFVRIPKKYKKNLLYTHAFSESGNALVVAFYDSAMAFVEAITTEADYITNADTYAYARAVYPIADTKCELSFTNETIKPDYAPPKKYLLYTNDLNSYGRNVISDGAISAIINTGLKYLGDERFGYGTEHTAFAESCIKTTKDTHTSSSNYDGERYQMDCSTYVLLMMMGITPECSRYFHTKNIPSDWGYRFNRLVEYEGYVYGVPQTGDTKRLYANSIADYAYKNGYLFLVNDDLSNIRPGDIFFLSNQSVSYGFFENIGHCGMVVDSVQLENGGRTIVTFEGNGGANSPCKYHIYTSRSARMIYAARFPMSFVHNDVVNIAELDETVTTVLSGTSGDAVDIATVNISKPFENGKVYTVCVKCILPDNCYLMLKDNGMSHMGVSNEGIIKRPDGYRTFHIFAKNTDTISVTNSITIQAKCTGDVNGSAVLSMARVYGGFVSPEFT